MYKTANNPPRGQKNFYGAKSSFLLPSKVAAVSRWRIAFSKKTFPVRLLTTKAIIILLIPAILFSHHVYTEDGMIEETLETLGYALLFIAALGRVWAAAYISGKKGRDLVVDGPYSLVRHPLYMFSALGFIGTGLALGSLTVAAFLLVVFFASHYPAMIYEERFLAQKFGQAAITYFGGTARLWPSFHFQSGPDVQTINIRVFTRAVLDAALIGLIFPATGALEWLHLHKVIPVLFHIY